MKWIGLTGGIGSGKSTVAKIIATSGFPVIDADALSREVVEPGQKAYEEIVSHFGPGVLLPDSAELDRKKIADIVFADHEQLEALEKITHPEISQKAHELRKKYASDGHTATFYVVPLLFENNLKNYFDEVVVVSCSLETQKQRVQTRDGFSLEEVESRLLAQVPLSEKAMIADFVIENDGSLEELEQKTRDWLTSQYQPQLKPNRA